jgi:two-component system CheB/CheR fusion protein
MNTSAFPIVGIGASAGGIEAFHSFFKHMAADCGMAFVILLHPTERRTGRARGNQRQFASN